MKPRITIKKWSNSRFPSITVILFNCYALVNFTSMAKGIGCELRFITINYHPELKFSIHLWKDRMEVIIGRRWGQ